MKLITDTQREQLLANGTNRDRDHPLAVKLFNPAGAGTWLVSKLDPEDPDIAFCLADLGCPELGSVRISELESFRGPIGLSIERDLHFNPSQPILCRGWHNVVVDIPAYGLRRSRPRRQPDLRERTRA